MRRNIKNFLVLCFIVSVIINSFSINAYAEISSGTCGDSAIWNFDSETGTLTLSGTGNIGQDEYNYNYRPNWNSISNQIKTVVIEEGITSICCNAFYACGSLTEINISSTVSKISDSAFILAQNLSNVIVNSENNYFVCEDNILYTRDMSELVLIPLGLNVYEYILPDTVKIIRNNAISTVKSIHFGEGISDYGDYLSYENITISDNNQNFTIKENTLYSKDYSVLYFHASNSSDTIVNIPEGCELIEYEAFFRSRNLTNINLPESLITIKGGAFYDCTKLQKIIIPDSVTTLQDSAFYNCSNLLDVSLGKGLTAIPHHCFVGCKSLKTFVIPDTITSIGTRAFTGCSNITEISIPNSMTEIEDYVFISCTNLTSITIPDSITTIGSSAFSACNGLKTITIPETVTSLGNKCFSNCKNLETIKIPKSVTSIGYGCFQNCPSLKSIVIYNPNCALVVPGTGYIPIFDDTATVFSLHNSRAQAYCNTYGIPFNIVCTDGTENHIYSLNANPPTCTTDGTATYTCTLCGYTYDEVQSATGHTPAVDDAVEPTCTENGLTEGQHCSICDEVLVPQATVDALGHTYVKTVYPATCTKEGYTEYICEACGDMYTADYTDILEHSFDNNAEYCLNGCMEKNPSYISPVTENTDVTILDNEQETTAPADEITEIEETTQIITQDAPQETVYQDITELQQNLTEIEKTQIEEAVTEQEQEEPKKYSGKIKTEYEAFRIVSGIKSVKIAWTNDGDLLGYEVYVSNSIDGDFKKIDDVKTKESHYTVINGLNSNSVYYFRLVGYLDYNGEIIKMEESRVKGVFVK